ncbi:RAN binding protein 3 [Echinococcus multilocularis]|uniref:RAN binding protein 3 n=1 Tax=Echinococcus multilocularis TaxID=6211 RepID=A0A068Y569_ECHMU|nr:RAN binding protein 3 [Echinococcus multilocularis]
MSASSERMGDALPVFLSSSSILRPSVLSDRLKVVDTDVKTSTFEPPMKSTKPLVEEPKFAPTRSIPASVEPTNAPGYVFGQNMSSRVVNANEGASENIWQAVTSDNYSDGSNQEDSSTSVFTTLAKAVAKRSKQIEGELLEDSAVALARKRNAAQISLPSTTIGEQHEIITGEEDERTVLELTCNAYVFDRDSKQWKGIGQSYLHLNDTTLTDRTTSRLIIRLQYTRRVVVNTRIWSEMPVAYVAENKAVRIGALTVAGRGQTDIEGAIRTYMLRFTAADSARFLFEALQERRLSAEKLETFVKRSRLEESQTSVVAANDATNASDFSHGESGAFHEKESNSSEHKEATTLDGSSVTKSTTVTAMSFLCRRVRLYAASGTLTEEVELDGDGKMAVVNITDFPQSGASVLEVNAPDRGAGSLLTAAIGSRLAFCRLGDSEVHLFCTTEVSDDTVEGDDVVDVARLDKSCRLQLASSSEAERLYRSILLRVVRLFMETSGMIRERRELNDDRTSENS